MSERERVRGRAVKNEKRFAIGFEDFAKAIAQPLRPFIVAVRSSGGVVRFRDGGERFRTNAGGVIARELVKAARMLHVDLVLIDESAAGNGEKRKREIA